jgi:hypothetical protein
VKRRLETICSSIAVLGVSSVPNLGTQLQKCTGCLKPFMKIKVIHVFERYKRFKRNMRISKMIQGMGTCQLLKNLETAA